MRSRWVSCCRAGTWLTERALWFLHSDFMLQTAELSLLLHKPATVFCLETVFYGRIARLCFSPPSFPLFSLFLLHNLTELGVENELTSPRPAASVPLSSLQLLWHPGCVWAATADLKVLWGSRWSWRCIFVWLRQDVITSTAHVRTMTTAVMIMMRLLKGLTCSDNKGGRKRRQWVLPFSPALKFFIGEAVYNLAA